MSTNDKEVPQESTDTTISQESVTSSPTGSTEETAQVRPDSPAQPASQPVTAQFKAGKDV